MKKFPWQILLDWFSKNGNHSFPWRQYYNNFNGIDYRVWLAEILLQQTQADRVVSFYERILATYPTIHTLANASYDEFFPLYQGLGYYSRARNLLKTAKIVSEEYDGILPRDKKLLRKLPGIGEYTARAILAFGYTEPVLAWDTNLETIFSRYHKGSKTIKLSEDEKNEIEEDFQNFIGNNENGSQKVRDINNALMDWARLMEPKNSSLLKREEYIFTESEFYRTEGTEEIIEKKTSTYFPIPDAQIIVILHQDHKLYYSSTQNIYSPFILPPSLDRDTRKYIQDYFRNTHNLELSVRPIHKKWFTKDGKPYIAVNAQIQAGTSDFGTFGKSEIKKAESSL